MTTGARIRREPPRFRRVEVQRVDPVTPRLTRVTLTGAELEGFTVDEPAASVRLLLPSPGTADLVMPAWNGNEFLLPDGTRPVIRTLTPIPTDGGVPTLAVEVVIHGGGAASQWAQQAAPGAPAAVSGPGRGYTVDHDAAGFFLAGDETAIPAIRQVLDAIAIDAPVAVHVEIAHRDARLALPRGGAVEWHELPAGAPPGDTLVDAAHAATLASGTRVWAAGEAAAMQRIRRVLFEELHVPRPHTTVRGYWKHGRSATGNDER